MDQDICRECDAIIRQIELAETHRDQEHARAKNLELDKHLRDHHPETEEDE